MGIALQVRIPKGGAEREDRAMVVWVARLQALVKYAIGKGKVMSAE